MSEYINYDDLARLEYGQLLWRNPGMRQRLIAHWTDARHPYRERFQEQRELIECVLSDAVDDETLAAHGTSRRAIVREIPPVFGSFWQV
ncbi:MAG: hypothetical protein WCS70_15020 [Verrucomicrobiota bacterium]